MMTKKIKHKLNFKNKEIFDHQSDFTGGKKRVFTPFNESKKTRLSTGIGTQCQTYRKDNLGIANKAARF